MLRVGIFGGGVVGGGVVELLQRHSSRLAALGLAIEVTKLCVRDPSKPRDFALPPRTQVVTGIDEILEDVSIGCVVEVIGGVTLARDIVLRAIRAGKHVVTANKALIATHMDEITATLSSNPSATLSFEAAVCGGIPIIHSLQTDFVGDEVLRVMGIMNGTTNFMLSKMQDEGADYGPMLREAQALGYVSQS